MAFRLAHGLGFLMMIAMTLAGCGGGSGGKGGHGEDAISYPTLSAQPVSGTVRGQPWYFSTGSIHESLDHAGELLVALTDATAKDPCRLDPSANYRSILFSIPKQVGSYRLGFTPTTNADKSVGGRGLTFSYRQEDGEWQNDVTDVGIIDVTTVSATEIKGRLFARYESEHDINGSFTATVCP